MEGFFARIKDDWPAGRADYHWHVLLNPELVRARLIIPHRELLRWDGLEAVPAVWTHITIERIAPVADLDEVELAQMTHAVAEGCRSVQPFTLTIRRPEIWDNGVICPVAPVEPLRQLGRITTTASRQATANRCGTGGTLDHPHLALAYAVHQVDDAPLRSWLSTHDRPEMQLPATHLSLVAQRHDGRSITWRLAREVPLGGHRPSGETN